MNRTKIIVWQNPTKVIMKRKTTERKDEQNRTHKTELSSKQRKLRGY